jgi:hypothetical protein
MRRSPLIKYFSPISPLFEFQISDKRNDRGNCNATNLRYSAQIKYAQHSTVQHSALQYSTVHYSIVQYSTAQHSTAQYSTVQCSTVQYSKKCNAVHCSTERQ